MENRIPLGIDLGTTNSAIAYVDSHQRVQLIPNSNGDNITPSVIYAGAEGWVVGREAREASAFEPDLVAMFFKREMGNRNYQLEMRGKSYDAEAFSAILLGSLREQAERCLPSLGPVIVTVPAYFHNAQREATMRAAAAAGLDIVRTINEPTAAAIAYGRHRPDMQGKVVVYDLGGGTFDVTLLEYSPQATRVIASDGNHHLGGVLWDDRLMNLTSDRFVEQQDEDPRDDAIAVADLRLRCEEAKKFLSQRQEVRIAVNCAGKRGTVSVTRADFEIGTMDLLEQTRVLLVRLLATAGVKWPEIDAVLLAGGSTRMPAVRQLVKMLSRKEPLTDIDPDECVAIGAAYEAAAHQAPRLGLPPPKRQTLDVTPHSLGYVAISPDGQKFINDIILKKNSPIPVAATHLAVLETQADRPNVLDLYLLQGESQRVLDNTVLGHYRVEDVPHSRGKATLEIGFGYDISGVVMITCREKQLQKPLSVSVVDSEVDLAWTDLHPKEYVRRSSVAAILVMDTSGSMSGQGIQEAIRAALSFLDNTNSDAVRVGLIEFGNRTGVVQNLTSDLDKVRSAVRSMQASGGTPLTEGLEAAERELAQIEQNKVVIVLTDGCPNSADSALKVGDRLKRDGVRIIAIGVGSADQAFLKRLASDAKASIQADFRDLSRTFSTIAQSLGSAQSGLRRLNK
jgi:molecular chaperone DnaK